MNADKPYGDDYYTVLDDEGNEYVLEHLDTIELNDNLYMSFITVDEINDNEMVIFKVVEENDDDVFEAIEDEEELESVYNEFMSRLFDDADDIDDE